MLENKTKQQSIRIFMITLVLFSFGAFLFTYEGRVEAYNTTILAFSYKYGFVSRSFIGTLYQALDYILPISIMNYEMAVRVTLWITIVMYAILFLFFYHCLMRCPEKYLRTMEYLLLFLAMNMVTMFSSKRNLGRLDIYMILLSVAAAWLIIKKRAEWLVIVFSAIAVMVHQGYVFMYLNIVLVLLFYQILSTKGREHRKYVFIFAASFLVCSGLFLWFELFSHTEGASIVDTIIKDATALSRKGEYHETLVDHEILGVDLTEIERPFHIANFIELPIFLLFMSPYIVLGICLGKKMIKKCTTKVELWKYWAVILGVLTIVPSFILKVDYARWFFAIFVYYIVVVIALMAMKDKIITESVHELMEYVRHKYTWSNLLMLYPVLFMPFWDVHVCELLKQISNPINETFLHIW